MSEKRFPVAILGAGPSGLLASIILSQSGIHHLLVEKRLDPIRVPAAHVLKTRTLEIYRMFGLEKSVHEVATPLKFQRYITYFDQLAGLEFGKLDLAPYRNTELFRSQSPTGPANLPQDELEAILLAEAQTSEFATIKFGSECIDHSDIGKEVEISLVHNDSSEEKIAADYLISAEGAASETRKRMGIAMQGPVGIAHFVTAYVKSDFSGLLKDREGVVHWCLNLDTPGVLVVHGITERAVFMIPYDPAEKAYEEFTEEYCADYIRNAIGNSDHPFEIASVGRWTMSGQVAEKYGEGRVFLVGDAAHRFPPTGGLGLNTGAQDVFNLIWKLREVLAGHAKPSLLETYESECRPIAITNCRHSVINHERNQEVPISIGLTESREAAERSIELLRAGGPACEKKRKEISETIAGQLRHYVSFGLDLGFVYEKGALVPDGTPIINGLDDPTRFKPSAQPGARFPHVVLKRNGKEISSHDLLGYQSLTLFIGERGQAWKEALEQLGRVSLPIMIKEIGKSCEISSPDGAWEEMTALTASGAMLVRPDGHVAWREKSITQDPKSSLAKALGSLHAVEVEIAASQSNI